MKNEDYSGGARDDWDALEERLLDFGARVGLVVDTLPRPVDCVVLSLLLVLSTV